jgi:hypothetical protein
VQITAMSLKFCNEILDILPRLIAKRIGDLLIGKQGLPAIRV